MSKTKAKKAATEKAVVLETYKGFDKDFKCRDFQFEVSQSYSVKGNIAVCENGFHACENPIDVWGYYAPGNSRFALVEQTGKIARHDVDSKIASAQITIKAELSLPDFIKRGVDYLLAQVDWKNAKESNTGYQSAATNTDYRSAATNTGDRSAATNTGNRSAATNTGEFGVALASGYEGRVSGADGCALFLVERGSNFTILFVWAGIVGRDGIKPDVFYILKSGKPVEWSAS